VHLMDMVGRWQRSNCGCKGETPFWRLCATTELRGRALALGPGEIKLVVKATGSHQSSRIANP
jgi:hypothetical protein